jgi:hypothetical protein
MGNADIWCRSCGHNETLTRALRGDDVCPACGGNIYRRKGEPPRPSTHVVEVLKALLTLRGIFFLIGLNLIALAGNLQPALAIAAAVMLTLASLKLAVRAMNIGNDGLEFPEVSPEELFDRRALLPAGVFAILFLVIPVLCIDAAFPPPASKHDADAMGMLGVPAGHKHGAAPAGDAPDLGIDFSQLEKMASNNGAPGDNDVDPALRDAMAKAHVGDADPDDDDDTGAKVAGHASPHKAHTTGMSWGLLALGIFLLAYAPMALVMFLRTGSTWALFFIPQGVKTILDDTKAYAGLALFAVPAFAGQVLLDRVIAMVPFYVGPIFLLPKTALILVGWGVCGLYVRQRARAFDMPVDTDDWVPHTRPPPRVQATAPEPKRVRPTAIGLDGVPDDMPDAPPITGTLLPPDDHG